MTVRWSETSTRHLQQIYDYIARDKEEAARATVERLMASGDALGQAPQIGRLGRFKGTREFIQPPYILVYSIESDSFQIHAVFHGSRDLR